jgi:ABC-type sugar transport system permease subunit
MSVESRVRPHRVGVATRSTRRRSSRTADRRTALWCLAFAAPALILAGMFTFWPMGASIWYSLVDWSGFTNTPTFIGLDNFRELLTDASFWSAFGRSFLFTVVTVPVKLVLTFLVAVILNNQALKMAPTLRALFFIPVVTTTAIVGLLMTALLSVSNGPVNDMLISLGLVHTPLNFLGDPNLAFPTVMVVSIWKTFGVSMIYWLAALQSVPRELLEAARLDRANWIKTQWYVTFPAIRPFALIILLVTAVASLKVFDLVQTMTGGGPYFSSEVIEVFIYRTAFAVLGGGVPRLGYASAAGVLFGVALMVLALVQIGASRYSASRRLDLGAMR